MILRKIKTLIKKKLVRVIIWDFDDTLYVNPEIGIALKAGFLKYLNQNLKNKISKKDFDKMSKKHGSWSKAVAKKLDQSEIDVVNYVEKKVNKSRFLKTNKKLVKQLENLTQYKQIILSNTPKNELIKCLKKLGFKNKNNNNFYPFEEIVDCNEENALKPNLKPFKKVLKLVKVHPKMIIMVGDSYKNDLEPAKKIGFQIIHVDQLKDFLGVKLANQCK